jgi:cytolysin-activating lysine-acyltransferase
VVRDDAGPAKAVPLFYAKNKPVGVGLWAEVDGEVAGRLSEGTSKLRPQDWKSGEQLWVVEAIAPFGGPEEMIKNLKAQVFPDKELRYLTMNAEGQKEVKVL